MILAQFQNTIESPWIEIDPVRVGTIPTGLGTPSVYVTVEADTKPLLRIDVYGQDECFAFSEALIWQAHVIIGFGGRVYFVPLSGEMPTTIHLDDYFGHLYPVEELLLVASGERLFCIGVDGRVRWMTDYLGIDGVLVHKIKDGVIYGDGEWDPPGGWKPFQVLLASGATILQPG